MNNIQTEKQSNKKNNQRPNNFQEESSSGRQGRNQDSSTQERGQRDSKSQDSSAAASSLASMIPVSAISSVVTSQLVDNFAPRIFEDIKDYLVEQFGEEKVESWMHFIKGEEVGDENAIYTLIRNAVPSLPEEFSLSNIMDWQPIKSRVTKSPVAAAAAVAAGVGALYLTREMLKNGNFSFSSVNDAIQSGKAKLSSATSKTKGAKKATTAKSRSPKKTTRARA